MGCGSSTGKHGLLSKDFVYIYFIGVKLLNSKTPWIVKRSIKGRKDSLAKRPLCLIYFWSKLLLVARQ